jgi:hypothetical protein
MQPQANKPRKLPQQASGAITGDLANSDRLLFLPLKQNS